MTNFVSEHERLNTLELCLSLSTAEAPPHYEQLHLLEENANVYQAPANPPPMTEAEIRVILDQMDQSMTTQAQTETNQAHAMTAQSNRDVAPRPHQQVSTMASRLRDFTRMNPPTFYGSKFDNYPQEFVDEVYKVLYTMGVTSSEGPSWPHINSRM